MRCCSKCNIEKDENCYYYHCPTICKKCCIKRNAEYRKTDSGKKVRQGSSRRSYLKTKLSKYKQQRDKLKDRYVVRILKLSGFGTAKEIRAKEGLIESKRTEILLNRVKRILKNKKTGEAKKCTRCLQIKDAAFFPLKNGKPISQCRDCENTKARIKYAKNGKKKRLKRAFI